MKNPFRPGRGTLTSGRACAVYALAFVLMLLLDAERFSGFLDRAGADFAPAAALGGMVREGAEITGLAVLSQAEARLVADFAVERVIGAEPAPQDAVADALGDFSRGDGKPPLSSAESLDAAGGASPASSASSSGAAGLAPQTPPASPSGTGKVSPHAPAAAPEGAATSVPLPDVSVDAREKGDAPTPVEPSRAPALASPDAVPPSIPGTAVPPQSEKHTGKPKVLLVGDSMMMEGFGPVLQRTLRKRPDMEVVREGKYSTGLSREDYFDWPAHLQDLVAKHNPDVIVICMGANDPQDIIDENKKRHHADSESWRAIYRSRAERLLAVATSRGAKVVWAGLPIMGKEPYATRIRRLSDVQEQACGVYHADFVDTVRVLADEQGAYATFKKDEKGRHVRLRYKDMVHVTEDGGAMLTAAVVPAIEKALAASREKASGPAASPAVSASPASPAAGPSSAVGPSETSGMPFTLRSALRSGDVGCYAFLPANRRPEERFPVVYLLHGAFEGADVWNREAGTLLTDLATRHRLVLIAPSCGKTGWYADSPLIKNSRMESFIVRELLPFVEAHFPVLPQRGIMGMSMGGHGAFALALRHPGLFASVSSMSGVLDITRHAGQWKIRDVLGPLASQRPLWESYSARFLLARTQPAAAPAMLITVGQEDAAVVPENRAFRDALRKGGFNYQYRESAGRHDWAYWREEIPLHIAFHAGILQR